ncbi:MAG: hypothetical protein QNJ40_16750 [Xanthomonadales bacterium]|nr:hypothetical protein [Xanthomonadales bacterium]
MRGLCLAALVIFCNGCVTGYQPTSAINNNGFSEIQLSKNSWEVQYAGNAGTTQKRRRDFVMLRAAELTLDAGFDYFTLVVSHGHDIASAYATRLDHSVTPPVGLWQKAGWVKPVPRNIVMGYREPPNGIESYPAADVAAAIKERYRLSP